MTNGHDDWTGWKPEWSKNNKNKTRKSPHDFQEHHSPTKSVRLKENPAQAATRHQQRIVDARLWKAMSPFQQNAALALEHAFHQMSKGLGYRTSAPHKLNFGKAHHSENDRDGEIIAFYFQWAEACKQEDLHHSAAIDVLVYGQSCRQVDRNRRVRNGWSKKNLLACLNIYCAMRGWPIEND